MGKRIVAYVMAIVVGLGVAVGIATPASAAPSCSAGYLCLYEHTGGNGSTIWYGNNAGLCINLPSHWNDRISSARNELNYQVRLYANAGCGGLSVGLGAACGGCLSSYINDMGGYFMNDTTTAIRFY